MKRLASALATLLLLALLAVSGAFADSAANANAGGSYELAARAFQPSGADVDFEYLVKDVRGKLAYTVAIERADVLYTGQAERREQVLRSTMIFRFDRRSWKIVHRHADTMVDLELSGSD
jgi:ketosteroid isomerase-like protein